MPAANSPSPVELSGSVPAGILKTMQLRNAQFKDALGQPSTALVVCDSTLHNVSPDEVLGKTLGLQFKTQGGLRHHHGVVTQFSHVQDASAGQSQYQFELTSWIGLLARHHDFRIYQNKSVVEILKDVLGRHLGMGGDFDESGLASSYPPLEYCVQFDETDDQFVHRLMEHVGIYYFVRHSAGNHTVVLCDHSGAHQPFPGYAQVKYSPHANPILETEKEVIQSVGVRKTIRTPKHFQRDYNFKKPFDELQVKQFGSIKPYNERYEKFHYFGKYRDSGEGKPLVQVQQQQEQALQKVVFGNGVLRGLVAGYTLQIDAHQIAELQAPLLLIESEFFVHMPPRQSGSAGAARFESQFKAIPQATPYRSPARTPKPVAHGIYLARVVGPAGQDIHTDEFGRIRVYFFWDRHVDNMPEASCWIRVAHPSAGKGWGMMTLPRIGQEVIVEFEGGDPDRPVVLGCLHNADQKVPYPLDANKSVSGWRTRSTVGGGETQFNEIRFEDKLGQEYIWLQAERDYLFLTKKDRQEEVRGQYDLLVKGQRKQTIQGADHLEAHGGSVQQVHGSQHTWVRDESVLNCNSTVSVSASGELVHHTQGGYSLHSDSDAQLKTQTTFQVQAGQVISLQAGGCSITIGPSGIYFNGPVYNKGPMMGAFPSPADGVGAAESAKPPVDPLA